MRKVERILRSCKITTKYKGYFYLPEAVQIAETHADEPVQVTKDIYPQIARKYHTSVCCVERNIRTVVERCWDNNKEFVQSILGYADVRCPSNMEFIDAVAHYEMEE